MIQLLHPENKSPYQIEDFRDFRKKLDKAISKYNLLLSDKDKQHLNYIL